MPHLEVGADPRIELLSAVQSVSNWERLAAEFRLGTFPDSSYRRDMKAWFEPYKDHPAVTQINDLLDLGFGLDAPVIWALHYGSPPALTPRTLVDEATAHRAGGQPILDALAVAFRDFTEVSRLQEFFDAHTPFYDQLALAYRQNAPGDDALALIENFYGERKAGYSVILAPAFGFGAFGFAVQESENEHIYNVSSISYKGGEYIFPERKQVSLMFHEFSHSFTNPAVHSERLRYDKYEFLFPAIAYKMVDTQPYGDWDSVVLELFVRANELTLMHLAGYSAEAEATQANYLNKGYYWLPFLRERLKEYQESRTKYPTYRSFVGRLLDVLDETSPVIEEGKLIGVTKRP